MKASELIKALQDQIKQHGDLSVKYFDTGWCEFSDILGVKKSEYEDVIIMELEE